MNKDEVRLSAMFDQIHACHRDAMAAADQFGNHLFQLPSEQQLQVVEAMHPLHRDLMLILAEEAGNQRLIELLNDIIETLDEGKTE